MTADEFPSVWTRPKRSGRRREHPALSQVQIVAEAIKLLDADGLGALSMRKLGAQLGAVATAIYWHVANKEELMELVVDQVYGEIVVPEVAALDSSPTPPPRSPTEWRAAVVESAHSLRSMVQRHPWTAVTLTEVGLTYRGPNMMRVSDRLIALHEAGGFGLIEADQASKTVVAYVFGIAALYAAHQDHDVTEGSEDLFTCGLDRILDGLEQRLRSPAAK